MKSQLTLWTHGAETVRVRAVGGALVIEHRVTAESRAREITLPLHRGLLIALREGIDQLLRSGVAS